MSGASSGVAATDAPPASHGRVVGAEPRSASGARIGAEGSRGGASRRNAGRAGRRGAPRRGGHRQQALAALALLLALGVAALARADTLRLEDGSVLRGELLEIDEEDLRFKTGSLGEVKVPRSAVMSVETEHPVTVRYLDGRELEGLVAVEDERMVLEAPGAGAGAAERPLEWAAIESLRPVVADIRYRGELEVGIDVQSGNTRTESFHGRALLEPSYRQYALTITGEVDRRTAEGDVTASSWRTNLELRRSFAPRWFFGVANGYENDELKDLNLRITASAHVGHRFFVGRPTSLSARLGPAFVSEDFENDADRSFAALRWALEFEQDVLTPDVRLYHDHTLTVGLGRRRQILLTRTGLRFGLVSHLNLKAEMQVDWNNDPTEGNRETDRRFLLTVGYDFRGDEEDWWQ